MYICWFSCLAMALSQENQPVGGVATGEKLLSVSPSQPQRGRPCRARNLRLWSILRNILLFTAFSALHCSLSISSIGRISFGWNMTTGVTSLWQSVNWCFLNAEVASFQYVNPLVMKAGSRFLLAKNLFLVLSCHAKVAKRNILLNIVVQPQVLLAPLRSKRPFLPLRSKLAFWKHEELMRMKLFG